MLATPIVLVTRKILFIHIIIYTYNLFTHMVLIIPNVLKHMEHFKIYRMYKLYENSKTYKIIKYNLKGLHLLR